MGSARQWLESNDKAVKPRNFQQKRPIEFVNGGKKPKHWLQHFVVVQLPGVVWIVVKNCDNYSATGKAFKPCFVVCILCSPPISFSLLSGHFLFHSSSAVSSLSSFKLLFYVYHRPFFRFAQLLCVSLYSRSVRSRCLW